MKNWTEILKQRHSRYYATNGSHLVLPPPMVSQTMTELKLSTNYQWTKEFFDLYSRHDGVGLSLPDHEVLWQFVPSSELVSFSVSIREWFVGTHPEISQAYHPFFDWGSGDAIGYLDLPEIPVGVLVEFEHEAYEFDADQPWSEFLRQSHDSILSFLET